MLKSKPKPTRPAPKDPVLTLKDAVLTYRYLRITMLAVLVMLGISVIWYALDAKCGLDSVSAYYYTPVRNVFVGALVAFGAALIAYHGPTREEEALLNLAGSMAIVIAFVPTVPASCTTPGVEETTSAADVAASAGGVDPATVVKIVDVSVTNNVGSLIGAALVAFVLAAVLTFVRKRESATVEANSLESGAAEPTDVETGQNFFARLMDMVATWWPKYGRTPLVGLCAAVPLAGVIAFVKWPEWFADKAHGIAAVVLVAALILYMIVNATLVRHSRVYKWFYAILATTLLGLLVALLAVAAIVGLNRSIFYLEFVILGVFAIYWMVQSIELRGQTTTKAA